MDGIEVAIHYRTDDDVVIPNSLLQLIRNDKNYLIKKIMISSVSIDAEGK